MSRVIAGLLIVVISLLSRVFKWDLMEKDTQEAANIIAEAVGALIIWWGRVKSTGTPITLLGMYKKPPEEPPTTLKPGEKAFLLLPFLLLLGGCSVFCKLDTMALQENYANVQQIILENPLPTDPILANAQKLRNDAALELAKNLSER